VSYARGDHHVRNISTIINGRFPSILSRRHRRSRLRVRHRQGVAFNDGRDFGDRRTALRERRSVRFDARYRRADRVARVAERAGKTGDDRAGVLRSGRFYPRAPPCRLRHRLHHKGEIRSQLAGGPVETFKVGQSFFEPPGATHLVSANASNTEPAELIAVFVADEGAQLTTFVE